MLVMQLLEFYQFPGNTDPCNTELCTISKVAGPPHCISLHSKCTKKNHRTEVSYGAKLRSSGDPDEEDEELP